MLLGQMPFTQIWPHGAGHHSQPQKAFSVEESWHRSELPKWPLGSRRHSTEQQSNVRSPSLHTRGTSAINPEQLAPACAPWHVLSCTYPTALCVHIMQ